MEEGNVTVLVDAKEEYTKQLISILKPCIYQGIKSVYLDSKDICNNDNTPETVLMVFQDLLSRIPKWSQDIINKEYQRIIDVSKCDYIEDLLKVVYVSHSKILTIVHSSQRNKKITIKVPSGSHFIHLCYIECAREFWKDPYLFSDRVSKYEHQKNMRDSENMISECIAETIRKQLPIRNILKEYLNEPDEDTNSNPNTNTNTNEDDDENDIKNPINKKYLKRLETMVKKELASLAKADSKTSTEPPIDQETKETIKNMDEDIIRKIIKEEMSLRAKEGEPTTTQSSQKEIVNDVVEKIIEQVETATPVSSPENNTTGDTIVSETLKIETETKSTTDANPDTSDKDSHTKEVPEPQQPTNDTIPGNTAEPTHDKVVNTTTGIVVDTTTETVIELTVDNANTNDDKTSKSKQPVEADDKSTTECSANLDKILGSIDTNIEIEELEPTLPPPTVDDNTNTVQRLENAEKRYTPIKIEEIEEINLNLDELDNEIEDNYTSNSTQNDIDDETIATNLDELEELDLKTVTQKPQETTNNGTKFIFFKDAPNLKF